MSEPTVHVLDDIDAVGVRAHFESSSFGADGGGVLLNLQTGSSAVGLHVRCDDFPSLYLPFQAADEDGDVSVDFEWELITNRQRLLPSCVRLTIVEPSFKLPLFLEGDSILLSLLTIGALLVTLCLDGEHASQFYADIGAREVVAGLAQVRG